jgi:Fe-S-cluster containining protein
MRKPVPELEMELVDALPGFLCRRCARCCAGKLIALYNCDIERIGPHVRERFCERTTAAERGLTGARYKMRMVDGRCVFLEKSLCKYYDLRPNTCRRHPFLVSEKHLLVSSTCQGVDWASEQNEGEYHSLSNGIAQRIDLFLDNRSR